MPLLLLLLLVGCSAVETVDVPVEEEPPLRDVCAPVGGFAQRFEIRSRGWGWDTPETNCI